MALLALLCLNLSLCSLARIRSVVQGQKEELARAAALPDTVRLTPDGLEQLHAHMHALHCRSQVQDGCTVYRKHSFGRYGSFITHLSILLTVVFGALALYTPTVTDRDCMPGESIFMPDGTEIHVFDFQLTDEAGRLDYQSQVQVTLPNGQRSEIAPLKVNHPFSFGPYKLFQQTFGTAGSLTVTNQATGGQDDFILTEMSFLSADGRNGLWYETLYPDYIRDPSGNVTLITLTEGSYPNPVYQVQVLSDGVYTPTLAFPGDELNVFGLTFRFNAPVEYPGLRIKHVSPVLNGLLVASFVLMIAGLYITFFYEPVLVKVDAEGYAVGGPKPERMRMDLQDLFATYERKEHP